MFTVERQVPHGVLVKLRIRNLSAHMWCVVSDTISPSQFRINLTSKVIVSRTANKVPLDVPCLMVKPGETREQEIDLRSAFTPDELRLGVLCYDFVYRREVEPKPEERRTLDEIGIVCEGREAVKIYQ